MEGNPQLVGTAGAPRFAAARALVGALRPRYVRVLVDWDKLQPAAGAPPDFAAARDGCARGMRPCAASAGLRALLSAIASRQKAGGGWEVVLTVYGTPAWAARAPEGCERSGTRPYARAPDPEAYRGLLRALQALGRELGVALPYWSPWNEPNHPAFLNPQRPSCADGQPAISAARYAQLATIAGQELAPGQSLVLGDLAGYGRPRRTAAGAAEFVDALPPEVACAPGPWAQHTYVGERPHAGDAALSADPDVAGNLRLIDAVDAALRRKGCRKEIWITETGAFDHACGPMAAALRQWADDPRITAAFQHSFREDPRYPVGLIDAGLRRPFPAYRAWRAYAGGPAQAPADPCGAARRARR
jgi:hypothetical protein